MNKQTILAQIAAAHEKLLAAINGLTPEQMIRVGAVGLWSVKDVLAHVTVWRSELITTLARLSANKAPHIVEIEDIDGWNMEQYAENARLPLEAILDDFNGAYKHLLKIVQEIDEKTLTNARKFTWMEGEPLSYLLAENGFWHETEHAEQILAWRQDNGL